MILVDTSVWISFLRQEDQDTTDILRSYLKKDEVHAVSAVFGELYQGVKNRREREIIDQIYESLPQINEDRLFIEAGLLSNEYKLYAKGVGLIDCYILAGCIKNELALWTKDKKLKAAYELVIKV